MMLERLAKIVRCKGFAQGIYIKSFWQIMQLSHIDFEDIKHNFVWSNVEIILILKNVQIVVGLQWTAWFGMEKMRKTEVLGSERFLKPLNRAVLKAIAADRTLHPTVSSNKPHWYTAIVNNDNLCIPQSR